MVSTGGPRVARRLFSPIASSYERWAAILSLGQDRRWRGRMVAGLSLPAGSLTLDVAAGTGSISRLLEAAGYRVTALDLSQSMLARHRGRRRVLGRGDRLPFPAGTFEAVTFGYLLRYVDDVQACLEELARVVRPGGTLAMVEFGRPAGMWYLPWLFYTGTVLPVAGRLIDPGWGAVGRFLRSSIETFHRTYPDLRVVWEAAGLAEVRAQSMSLGGGLVMWGRKL